jgi:hypothetical protein
LLPLSPCNLRNVVEMSNSGVLQYVDRSSVLSGGSVAHAVAINVAEILKVAAQSIVVKLWFGCAAEPVKLE